MRAVTTALDVLAVLMVATALVITGAVTLGWLGVALGLALGSLFVGGASAAASRKPSGGESP